MLEVINLGCIRGDRRLFRGLNFEVSPGTLLELRGPNGGGKTSLLRIICGLATPAEGEVRWNGTNIRKLREEYFAYLAYVAHLNGVKDELTALENLLVAERVSGREQTKQDAEDKLARVGLTNQRYLPTRFLSAGQRRRLALARLPASRATLWILDEILTSLDDAGIDLARDLIADHLDKGGMAIIATHQDLNLSAPRIQVMNISDNPVYPPPEQL
ncbi:MAG TPA: cytochrome c biogenesis heme-transporting ATPase CcmA [Pyrinomonadaceae bacterium]|jgi:heme exporter protein A|nr:cytochrome c biogenesis heme-transporting ATPase CcmA [Pyrinomonadaceae bacterium]